jgi:hypothetical protein
MDNNDDKLVYFLRELSNSIESKQLEADQLKCVGEFYMSYKFNEQKNGRLENYDNDFEDMDIIKFLTLGWFFYTQMNTNDNNIVEPVVDTTTTGSTTTGSTTNEINS